MNTNRNRVILYFAGVILGVCLVVVGIVLNDKTSKEITGLCFGVGAGLFGMFLSKLINLRIESKNPEAVRSKNIEVNDERNSAIRDRAGARTNRFLSYSLPVVALSFSLMDVELIATLFVCGLILVQAFVSIFYHGYYSKRM